MKISLVWTSPRPEKTIATAMRRCYSTKPIEEIDAELEQKGEAYWKFLLVKALQDKSLDVIEHFTMTLIADDVNEVEAGRLAVAFPFIRFLRLDTDSWLLSMNARTLIEMWRSPSARRFAGEVARELEKNRVCPLFNSLAFGEEAGAS